MRDKAATTDVITAFHYEIRLTLRKSSTQKVRAFLMGRFIAAFFRMDPPR